MIMVTATSGRPRNDQIDLDPIVPVVKKLLRGLDLQGPLKVAFRALDSSALMSTTLASVKSAPYAFFLDHSVMSILDNGISCRIRYAESALLSTAGLVYNFVLALCFSVGSLVTLGRVPMVTAQMQKHWIHTACAIGGMAISTIGTVSPEWGVKANAAAFLALGAAGVAWLQKDTLGKIPAVYRAYAQELKEAAIAAVGNDQQVYRMDIKPLLKYLDKAFEPGAFTPSLSDFVDVAKGASRHVPRLYPKISQELALRNLEELFA